MSKCVKILIFLMLVFVSTNIFAANPSQPFLPSDNVQDPNCTPQDSNCYVAVAGGSATSTIMHGGNSFGTTLTIGTNDNKALNFETNNVTAMTILANGNVGIGTSDPEHPLDVYGSAFIEFDGSASFAGGLATVDSGGVFHGNGAGLFNISEADSLRNYHNVPNSDGSLLSLDADSLMW